MEKVDFIRALDELMGAYNRARATWIEVHGDDRGFDHWFTMQVKRAS